MRSHHRDTAGTLDEFVSDVGVPEALVTDGAAEFVGRDSAFVKGARHHRVRLHRTEPNRKNQNHAIEREIGILAQRWRS